MPLAWVVTVLLLLFGVYSVAPVFGLDDAYPDLFRPYGPLSWAMTGLVVLGAVYWAVRRIRDRKDDG